MHEQKNQFVDIYDVWYQPWWQSFWWYVFFTVLACLIIISVVYYGYRRGWFTKKLSCDQQSLKNLNSLAGASYESSEKIYAAYFQLTLILKTYFAARYHLTLIDKTDLEIVSLLKTLVSEKYQPLLAEFLQRAFTIKFAHDSISEQMLQDDIKFVKKIIEQTTKDFDKVGRS